MRTSKLLPSLSYGSVWKQVNNQGSFGDDEIYEGNGGRDRRELSGRGGRWALCLEWSRTPLRAGDILR